MLTRHDALTEYEFHAEGGCSVTVGPRGGVTVKIERWVSNGNAKTWKRREDVRVPVKHGMYDYSYVLWPQDASLWHTRENCPIRQETHWGRTPS